MPVNSQWFIFFISPWPFFYSKRPSDNVVYGFSLDNKIFDFVLEDGDLKICLENDGRSDDVFKKCAVIPWKMRIFVALWHRVGTCIRSFSMRETNANRSGLSSLKKNPLAEGGLSRFNNWYISEREKCKSLAFTPGLLSSGAE